MKTTLAIDGSTITVTAADGVSGFVAELRVRPRRLRMIDGSGVLERARRWERGRLCLAGVEFRRKPPGRPVAQRPKAGWPWTADEDALLGSVSDLEVAQRTGRTLVAVQSRRQELRMRMYGELRAGRPATTWPVRYLRILPVW